MSSTDRLDPTTSLRTSHRAYLKRRYFAELDGLRAISVLLVISWHLYDARERWAWLAGYRGVTIFFVLSGYLITTLALREESARGRLSLAAFYVRRCFRIFPLYYITLGLYCLLIFGLNLSPHLAEPLRDALPYYLLYLQEGPFCLWQILTSRDLVFVHSWTLGVEEKFYLFWPLIAFVLWRADAFRRVRNTAVATLLLALIPALLTLFGPLPQVIGRMLFCYCSLLAGCLLAFLLHDPAWFARLQRFAGTKWAAAILLLFLAAHFTTPWVSGVWLDAMNAAYTCAATGMLACFLLGDGSLKRLLSWRPLAIIGRLSYGIYLIHMVCMAIAYRLLPTMSWGWPGSVLALVATSILSIAAAGLLHVTVESFGIELGRRWSRGLIERAQVQPPALEESRPAPVSPSDVPFPALASLPRSA
jgi:peptidoglycan/LPS O-acetylase OafA/YrhL